MESSQEKSFPTVIQYCKRTDTKSNNSELILSDSFKAQNSVENDKKEVLTEISEDIHKDAAKIVSPHDSAANKTTIDNTDKLTPEEIQVKIEKSEDGEETESKVKNIRIKDTYELESLSNEMGIKVDGDLEKVKLAVPEALKQESDIGSHILEETKEECTKENECVENENQVSYKRKKRKFSETNAESESVAGLNASAEDAEPNEDGLESDFADEDDEEEDTESKPRRRGRCKKNPDIIPSHLSSDIVLGYKILLKFLETPQFSGFHKPFKRCTETEDCKITCLNQIKKKFEENSYNKVCEFVNDVREMLINIYESRNTTAIKKALRLEQILEQRIAQLPNYLRPQCALVLSPDEVNNSLNKIRITKGGGFVSLLLEKTEKKRYEKNREKRKLLAEERKQLKEEQDKDVQEWEKNVLLKDFEEDIKSMWELPAIGHFIHLCADIFNIGEVAQFEVERMLLMPQCSDTLDLIMTALLTNSLVRAKLDRTPSMPYSIWAPLVKTRVVSWYRTWHREGRNEQKVFEEIGIEPEFWQILGPDINPLDYYYFHEISLLQRVWVLKTLCDVDFVRKKTVHDNIRAQTLDELNPVQLGLDQQGNRYLQFKQFSGSDLRIYRQSSKLDGDMTPSELIESIEGFEHREGPITAEKVFRDIWELNEKPEVKVKKKKVKTKRARSFPKVNTPVPAEKKNLRRSVRAKQKTYVDWSDSDQSDTDLSTLKNKLTKQETESLYRPFSDKEFISLSVFRLPRDKVNKPTSKKSSYTGRRTEEASRSDGTSGDKKTEFEDRKEEVKSSCCEDELSDSLDTKQMRDIRMDLEKILQGSAVNGDEFDLREKIGQLEEGDVKFTVKNLENLKMVLKKGASLGEEPSENVSGGLENVKGEENSNSRDKEYDSLYKYNVPNHLKPDSSKFYLVVDSVEGLRQLISKFGSHENDLEIITRSTKSKKKSSHSNTSCEVQLIDKLQNLLVELEPWELDLMKSYRSNKEKMYKEYMNFINRPPDFVHPNEAYWVKTYEEPPATTASSTATTTTTTTTTATTTDGNATNGDKSGKETAVTNSESVHSNQQDGSLDCLVLRKRTRVTRLQLQPETDDLDDDFDDGDDYESNESDDNWVLPTPKKRSKKETTSRTPKFPRRSAGRRAKSQPFEKTESQASSGEKSQNSSPDKAKKALFWGPRSSDPSEDLNWETNRQKILEQHNSPVKKVLFKSEDVTNDAGDSEKQQKCDNPSTSVIKSSSKLLGVQIPGNKKPYFGSSQIKVKENEGKKESEEKPTVKSPGPRPVLPKPEVKTIGSNTSPDSSFSGIKSPRIVQTYSRIRKAVPKQAEGSSGHNVNTPGQSPTKQVAVLGSKVDVSAMNSQQVIKMGPQIMGQIEGPVNSIQVTNQKVQNVAISSAAIQQSPVSHAQILQPVTRVQQIQIQEPQNRTPSGSVATVKMQQPVQWQPKIISVQPVNQAGKIVQPQVQTQPQVQIQAQPQVQLQNQSQVQVQGPVQQVIRLEPQKLTAVQQPIQVQADKLGTILQTQSGNLTTDSDNLYITDGKHLIKFDNNFVQQYLQKDKVLTLDMKKTLLLVKPKTDSGPSTSQSQPQSQTPTTQQNILVINKPGGVQQTVAPSSVPNFVIPGNYIIKEGNQVQVGSEPQTVKIIQQPPAYVIQQKSGVNKPLQTQVIKIITTQPMATTPNVIISPANINVAGQVIQPVNQTVISSNQQTKPLSTLRFMRPQIATSTALSTAQTKINPVQSPIIVNNIVQIQGQGLDTPKTQVVSGRIVSASVPTVRMAAPVQGQTVIASSAQPLGQMRLVTGGQPQPVQTQTVVASTSLNPQAGSVIAQPVRLAAVGQPLQSQTLTPVTSANTSSQLVTTVSNASSQAVKIVTSVASQQLQAQAIASSSSLNQATITQTVRLATSGHQTVIPSTNVNSHVIRSATALAGQTVRLTTCTQSQTLIPASINSQVIRTAAPSGIQTVRLATSTQSQTLSPSSTPVSTQTVRLISPSQVVQTQTVGASTNQSPQVIGSTATVSAQPMKIVTGLQAQTVVPTMNLNSQTVRFVTTGQSQPVRLMANNNVGVRFINRNVAPVKTAVITSTAQPVVAVRPSGIVCQPVRFQAIVQPTGTVRPAQNRMQLTPTKKVVDANALANAPVIIVEDEEDVRIVGEKVTEPPVTVDYIHGELSVKKTSQGWKYAVKASNGKDIILTDEQIEERLKANNGVMK